MNKSLNVFPNYLKIHHKFPRAKILYSLLLPRKDNYDRRIPLINQLITEKTADLTNLHLVDHDNVDSSAIYDNKHLSKRVGVPLFARNLILALNGKLTGNSNPKTHLANVKNSHLEVISRMTINGLFQPDTVKL